MFLARRYSYLAQLERYGVGFYKGDLVVHNMRNGAGILSIPCGGSHRAYEFHFACGSLGSGSSRSSYAVEDRTIPTSSLFQFAFVRGKSIHVHRSSALVPALRGIDERHVMASACDGVEVLEEFHSFVGNDLELLLPSRTFLLSVTHCSTCLFSAFRC